MLHVNRKTMQKQEQDSHVVTQHESTVQQVELKERITNV
jgi:hypothetical protein